MDARGCGTKQADYLFCSKDGVLRIVDIPLSIALSQHIGFDTSSINKIISVAAPTEPYTSTEPKSEKGKANLLSRIDTDTLERNKQNAAFIRDGLGQVKGLYDGPWLSSRVLHPDITALEQSCSDDPADDLESSHKAYEGNVNLSRATSSKPFNLDQMKDKKVCIGSELRNRIVYNSTDLTTQVVVSRQEQICLSIPPQSAFYAGNISPSSIGRFVQSAKASYPEPSMTAAPGQFDIILMDPPWSNRSIVRGHQYPIFDSRSHDRDAVSAVNSTLPEILAPDGVLAIWITNKASVRQRVTEIFEENGIELIEEWIWLKVTSKGEPVLPIDGMYRQPWETCLIGRRDATSDEAHHETKRKLIVACPELHSRKPWIGSMLVELYGTPQPQTLRKLEIFARCIPAGWCAWGEEATKFNDMRWWQQDG